MLKVPSVASPYASCTDKWKWLEQTVHPESSNLQLTVDKLIFHRKVDKLYTSPRQVTYIADFVPIQILNLASLGLVHKKAENT